MRFWQLNKYKILNAMLAGMIFGVALAVVTHKQERSYMRDIVYDAPFFGLSWLLFFVLIGLGDSIVIRLQEDSSENSIIPLFDNGYTMQLLNEKSWLSICSEYFAGTIKGLPVEVRYKSGGKNTVPRLSFTFRRLCRPGYKPGIEKTVDFQIFIGKTLKTDIKPDVLKFVDDLISKGYEVEKS